MAALLGDYTHIQLKACPARSAGNPAPSTRLNHLGGQSSIHCTYTHLVRAHTAGYAWQPEMPDNALMVSNTRMIEYKKVLSSVTSWAERDDDIVAVGLIGSWARGGHTMDSDVDIIVLTPDMMKYTATDAWIEGAVGQSIPVVRRAEWGVLTERRLRLPSGFEVEVGFVNPSWASIDPLDGGTAEVVEDGGLVPLYDPEGSLARLVETAS